MPTITVPRELLFQKLGRRYTKDEFDELCFEFGIELDEETTEKSQALKEKGIEVSLENVPPEDIVYKIEVPANRYDLLCFEGIARALSIFLKNRSAPNFRLVNPSSLQQMIVTPQVKGVRPFVLCAILRNVTFTEANYKSFIDLQDKLHGSVGRKRTLVSIGTHDLDTIQGPFIYEALPPTQINFVPLNETKSFDAEQLMKHLEHDSHLKKYLSIIRDGPLYPVIYDRNRTVLSLPPIINGDHSKITLKTKNVFIEVTATDMTKAEIALNTIVAMFSEYSSDQFTVEPVEIIDGDSKKVWPNLTQRSCTVSVDYINRSLELQLDPAKISDLLTRMGLTTIKMNKNEIELYVPITRSDILHACDVMEDVAIAYGYNNLSLVPPKTLTIGKQQPLNKLTDLLRHELAQCGYIEVFTLSLCSKAENFEMLNRPNNNSAIVVSEPQTQEFQTVRTSLLVGLLKSLHSNKHSPLPHKAFEISDVAFKDSSKDVGARNSRRMCVAFSNVKSELEVIHGILDRVMLILKVPYDAKKIGNGYYVRASEDPTFMPGLRADVIYNNAKIGVMGVAHPIVLKNFEISYPCSLIEIDIEPFV